MPWSSGETWRLTLLAAFYSQPHRSPEFPQASCDPCSSAHPVLSCMFTASTSAAWEGRGTALGYPYRCHTAPTHCWEVFSDELTSEYTAPIRDLYPVHPRPAHLGSSIHPVHPEMEFQIESAHSYLPTSSFPFDREARSLGFGVRYSSVESLRSAASGL